jgi:hypothetical protein
LREEVGRIHVGLVRARGPEDGRGVGRRQKRRVGERREQVGEGDVEGWGLGEG